MKKSVNKIQNSNRKIKGYALRRMSAISCLLNAPHDIGLVHKLLQHKKTCSA